MGGKLIPKMSLLKREAKNKEEHYGMGLYIVKLIAEGYGGKVEIENYDVDRGTILRVQLPLKS